MVSMQSPTSAGLASSMRSKSSARRTPFDCTCPPRPARPSARVIAMGLVCALRGRQRGRHLIVVRAAERWDEAEPGDADVGPAHCCRCFQ